MAARAALRPRLLATRADSPFAHCHHLCSVRLWRVVLRGSPTGLGYRPPRVWQMVGRRILECWQLVAATVTSGLQWYKRGGERCAEVDTRNGDGKRAFRCPAVPHIVVERKRDPPFQTPSSNALLTPPLALVPLSTAHAPSALPPRPGRWSCWGCPSEPGWLSSSPSSSGAPHHAHRVVGGHAISSARPVVHSVHHQVIMIGHHRRLARHLLLQAREAGWLGGGLAAGRHASPRASRVPLVIGG